MMQFNQVVIFVTVGTDEEAGIIADILLEERKAACVSIIPTVDSRFRWEGNPQREQETVLIIKTRASLVDEVVTLIKTVHSYDVPEIIALPVIGGNPDYLQWVDEETEQELSP